MRRLCAVLIVVAAIVSVTGCGPRRAEDPTETSLPAAFGVRVTDGDLRVWTGSPCVGTTSATLTFDFGDTDAASLRLITPAATAGAPPPDPGVEVEYLTVNGPNPGFTVSEALPTGYDWRAADTVLLALDGPPVSWGRTSELAEAVRDSSQHPEDTYWFQGVGWLNPAEVAARDGTRFLAFCTPDPERE